MRSFSKLVALSLAVVSLAAVAGSASAAGSQNIVGVAAGSKDFTTLVTLVKASGLAPALSGKGQLTVFAPTNAAFASLEKAVPGVTKALTDPKNKALLVQVLKYHVLSGEVKAPAALAAAKKNAQVPTLLGKNANGQLALGLVGGKIRIADSAGLNKATVVTADLDATNGVVHAINKVVVPKSVANALKQAGLIS